jgi:hypothetical protein
VDRATPSAILLPTPQWDAQHGQEVWQSTQQGIPTDGWPKDGVADSLDEAKAAFRAARGRQRIQERT